MNYSPIVLAFSAAATADGVAVATLVEARSEAGFNADACMVAVSAMLIELTVDGVITDGTAKTRQSMIRKLATCEIDALIDAAAQAAGLSAVYKLVCNSTAKTTNAGAKKKNAGTAAAAPAAAAAAAAEIVSLADVLLIMQNIRNNVLPKLSSDMGLLEDCDNFVATLRAKAGKAGK